MSHAPSDAYLGETSRVRVCGVATEAGTLNFTTISHSVWVKRAQLVKLAPWGTTALCAFVRVRSLDGNNLGEVGGQAIGAGLAHTPNLEMLV